jgi:hypothetical protein
VTGDAGCGHDVDTDSAGLRAGPDRKGEVLGHAAGDVRELPRAPDLPGTAAAG